MNLKIINYQRQKLVYAGALLVLLFLILQLQNLTSSSSKFFEILLFSDSYTYEILCSKNKKIWKICISYPLLMTWSHKRHCLYTSNSFTINLRIIKSKTKIGSCRSPFGPSFPNSNCEIIESSQFPLKIIWNTAFLR